MLPALEAALDRQFQLVLDTSDPRLFMHRLIALWTFLTTEPMLAGTVSDAMKDARMQKGAFDATQRQVADEALALLETHRRRLRRVWPTEDCGTLEDMAKSLRNPQRGFFVGNASGVGTAVGRFRDAVAEGVESLERGDGGLRELLDSLSTLQERSQHAERVLAGQKAARGGFAALCLADLTEEANPMPSPDPMMRHMRATFARFRPVAQELYGHGPVDTLSREIEGARNSIATLREDLRMRLVLGRSRLAMVRRFAGRCERYEADELNALFQRKASSKNVEHQLTMRFARYLYDQGLNPLVDPKIARLRPDVYAPIPGHPFYVEAKQYDSKVTPGKLQEKMRKAVSQVLDTWGGLAQQEPIPEAFLLVFRRGGPRLDLPELLRVEGGRLYMVLADIAPASVSGSRNKLSPVRMDAATLLGQLRKAGT